MRASRDSNSQGSRALARPRGQRGVANREHARLPVACESRIGALENGPSASAPSVGTAAAGDAALLSLAPGPSFAAAFSSSDAVSQDQLSSPSCAAAVPMVQSVVECVARGDASQRRVCEERAPRRRRPRQSRHRRVTPGTRPPVQPVESKRPYHQRAQVVCSVVPEGPPTHAPPSSCRCPR